MNVHKHSNTIKCTFVLIDVGVFCLGISNSDGSGGRGANVKMDITQGCWENFLPGSDSRLQVEFVGHPPK